MLVIPKLHSLLGVIFILVTAGTITVVAQTNVPNVALPINPVASADSINKKSEVAKPAIAPADSAELSNTTDVTRGARKTPNDLANNPVAASAPTAATDKWQVQIVPYLWIAGISGTSSIGNLTAKISAGITDSSVHINFGFMGTFDAHKNRLVILTDLQYSDLGTTSATPGPGFTAVEGTFKTFVLDPEIGYRVVNNEEKGRFVDILGGIRFWHLNDELKFTAGVLPAQQVSASSNWVDGVGGIRGRAALSKKLFVSGKADLGGGGSKFTYQLFGGAGINLGKRVAMIVGYRDLYVNRDRNNLKFDMSLHGPIIGFGIKF